MSVNDTPVVSFGACRRRRAKSDGHLGARLNHNQPLLILILPTLILVHGEEGEEGQEAA
jgi:hypothetical protein